MLRLRKHVGDSLAAEQGSVCFVAAEHVCGIEACEFVNDEGFEFVATKVCTVDGETYIVEQDPAEVANLVEQTKREAKRDACKHSHRMPFPGVPGGVKNPREEGM